MPIQGASNLPPIEIPKDDPLVPEWAREAIRRLNMIVGAKVTTVLPVAGYGSSLFVFGDGNAVAIVPFGGISGTFILAKITGGGSNGQLNAVNGQITKYVAPS